MHAHPQGGLFDAQRLGGVAARKPEKVDQHQNLTIPV
jgi:hypothetical protein